MLLRLRFLCCHNVHHIMSSPLWRLGIKFCIWRPHLAALGLVLRTRDYKLVTAVSKINWGVFDYDYFMRRHAMVHVWWCYRLPNAQRETNKYCNSKEISSIIMCIQIQDDFNLHCIQLPRTHVQTNFNLTTDLSKANWKGQTTPLHWKGALFSDHDIQNNDIV